MIDAHFVKHSFCPFWSCMIFNVIFQFNFGTLSKVHIMSLNNLELLLLGQAVVNLLHPSYILNPCRVFTHLVPLRVLFSAALRFLFVSSYIHSSLTAINLKERIFL